MEGDKSGFPPCTPTAVVEILKHYDVELNGANVAVLGRSMVVGKPAAMLLLNENATVTICHSRTKNLEKVTSQADILVAAVGRAKMIKENSVKEGAVVIDVGINVDENGNLCGDVDTASVQDKVSMITPIFSFTVQKRMFTSRIYHKNTVRWHMDFVSVCDHNSISFFNIVELF